MAYVVWRVVMKKYSRIRLGLNGGSSVTPSTEKAITYSESSWTQKSEEQADLPNDNSDKPSGSDTSSRGKKTKVKQYFKKCKNALANKSAGSEKNVTKTDSSLSGKQIYRIRTSEISEIEDVFYDALVEGDGQVKLELASSVLVKDVGINKQPKPNNNQCSVFQTQISISDNQPDVESNQQGKHCGSNEERDLSFKSEGISSPILKRFQEQVDDETDQQLKDQTSEASADKSIKNDVERIVEKHFGNIYENYGGSKKCLIRQARDLLVCEYRGCLGRFEEEFCIPASKLLLHIKDENSTDSTTPRGWPLCLGQSGVVIQLGPLDTINLRNSDCYLCVRNRSQPGLEVSLIWKIHNQIHSHTVAELLSPLHSTNDIMCSTIHTATDLEVGYIEDVESSALPELLQNLLVSVEHAIKRVPLDDLTFPCPQCHQYLPLERQVEDLSSCSCQCLCNLPESNVVKKDSSIQTSPMFEFVGSIPHIDSDEDAEDKESHKSGTLNKKIEIARPRSISELPDKLLMSGINLPGTVDRDGRPIILCYAECISRAALNKYEIAKLLQYYASLPTSEARKAGFTILLVAENEADYKILELLDKSVCLIASNLTVSRFLVWTPSLKQNYKDKTLASQAEAIFICEESSVIDEYLSKDQAPASCGGSCIHDQLEWVEFFKQLEPFLVQCKTAGKTLLSALSYLRNEELPQQITRRFLNHQCRQISKALDSEIVQKLKREGNKTLTSLSERSQWLSGSEDVSRGKKFAQDSFNAVERVTKRLQQLKHERMERLKELARFRTLQEEAEELNSWIGKVGEETLTKLTLHLRNATDSTSVKEIANNFDDFFFKAWKQIEKSNDLIEECRNIKEVKRQELLEIALNLTNQTKRFRENLEDTREKIEDSSRCFLLLESCHDILDDDSKEQEEFFKLAHRSGNEKLAQICQDTNKSFQTRNQNRPPETEHSGKNRTISTEVEIRVSSTPYKSQNNQIRRRSVSSLAFIYHCSHHAAGEICNCYESDTENSISFKLKKRYMQALQNCTCQSEEKRFLERKNSGALGEIKEERESVENILEKLDSTDNCRRCDSGLSTAENSITDESLNSFNMSKRIVRRTCSCRYDREGCVLCSTTSSSNDSNQDTLENQQDSVLEESIEEFQKSHSSDDIEDENYREEQRKVPSLSANNHLYCHASTLNLPLDAFYNTMDSKTQKTLTYIIKEMIETERDYVKSLDYVITNYIPELQREDIPQALRGHRNTVFGNIEKIYEFHRHHFIGELEECECNPLQVGQIFLKYDRQFYLYALYNKNKPKSDSLMSEYGSTFFKSKQIELNDKMDLASYLLKPVQRMGKYALLLQQMMKACPKSASDSPERVSQEMEDLKQAEEMVRFQLRHGNDLLAMDSIRECDVNLKEQGRLLRQNEFLVWEGRGAKKSVRQVFLFEELILFSKARRFPDRKNLDLYIYKNSIKMTDIGLTARIGDSPTKFEIWFRKRKPNDTFTLQSMSEDVKRAWVEELSQLLWRQAIKNRAVRMAEMSSMGIGNKPCLDIRPSIDQISDRSISFAQLSKTAPRFRNSIASSLTESCRNIKRPHSVISMSSVSSSSTSSGGSVGSRSTPIGPINSNANFEATCDTSNNLYHRSGTLHSQCSVESGIIADMSVASDDLSSEQPQSTTS